VNVVMTERVQSTPYVVVSASRECPNVGLQNIIDLKFRALPACVVIPMRAGSNSLAKSFLSVVLSISPVQLSSYLS
jgi:hypothetical protein